MSYPAHDSLLDDPTELDRLHSRAHREAPHLRRAAIDDFWRDANAALSTRWGDAHRSAERLAASLKRHAALR